MAIYLEPEGKHSYQAGCPCKRCAKEAARRDKQASTDPRRFDQQRQKQAQKHARWARGGGKGPQARRPVVGSAEWAETRGDDLGESPDY